MGQVRSERTCQRSPGLEEEMANLWTQQHILIQCPKSCALYPPLLSVHLGGNTTSFHPLVPRIYSLHCHQQPPEFRRQWCIQQIYKASPHGILFLSIPSKGSLTSYKNAEEMWAMQTLWTAIRGCSAHFLWHLCLFMLVRSLILPVILPNCPSCWRFSPTNTRELEKLSLQETFLPFLVQGPITSDGRCLHAAKQ